MTSNLINEFNFFYVMLLFDSDLIIINTMRTISDVNLNDNYVKMCYMIKHIFKIRVVIYKLWLSFMILKYSL